MKQIEVNGKTITTNFNESGANTVVAGNDFPNYTMKRAMDGETDRQFLERLVDAGYTRIRFAQTATRVKGYHSTVAYCRR